MTAYRRDARRRQNVGVKYVKNAAERKREKKRKKRRKRVKKREEIEREKEKTKRDETKQKANASGRGDEVEGVRFCCHCRKLGRALHLRTETSKFSTANKTCSERVHRRLKLRRGKMRYVKAFHGAVCFSRFGRFPRACEQKGRKSYTRVSTPGPFSSSLFPPLPLPLRRFILVDLGRGKKQLKK